MVRFLSTFSIKTKAPKGLHSLACLRSRSQAIALEWMAVPAGATRCSTQGRLQCLCANTSPPAPDSSVVGIRERAAPPPGRAAFRFRRHRGRTARVMDMSPVASPRCLVLGGSGYLGGHVLQRLRHTLGPNVAGTGRHPDRDGLIAVDVMNLPMLEALVRSRQPSVVLWALQADHDEATLIDHGLANVLAVLPPTTRFVFVSSDAVLGRGSGPYFEDDPPTAPSAGSATAAYATAKIRDEATVQASRAAQPPSCGWVRCTGRTSTGSGMAERPSWCRPSRRAGRWPALPTC